MTRSIRLAIERQRHLFAMSQQALMKKMLDKIRQSIEPKTILKTASEIVREFLRCDRLLIYGGELGQHVETAVANGTSSTYAKSLQIIEQFISATKFPNLSTLFSKTNAIYTVEDTNNCSSQLIINPQDCSLLLTLPNSALAISIN